MTDINIFAEFVQFLNSINRVDMLLKVGDPNVAAEKWKNGDLVISANGSQEWWKNDKRHRDDGPAVTWDDGAQYWFQNGKLHRDETDADGALLPAVKELYGSQSWWKNGNKVK